LSVFRTSVLGIGACILTRRLASRSLRRERRSKGNERIAARERRNPRSTIAVTANAYAHLCVA
jgi:hypothetical protein